MSACLSHQSDVYNGALWKWEWQQREWESRLWEAPHCPCFHHEVQLLVFLSWLSMIWQRGKFVEKGTAGEKREFHCLREPQVCQQQSDRHTCSWGPDISRSLLRFTALGHTLCDSDRMTDCIILKKPSNHMLSSSICSSETHLHPLNICRNTRGSTDPQHK